jgi:hypothetical protein
MNPLVIIGILGALALVGGVVVSSSSVDTSKFTKPSGHKVGAVGWVETDPRELADSAGAPLDTYALASMIRSEAGGSTVTQLACGWTAKNKAEARGISIFELLIIAGRNEPGTNRLNRHPSYGFFASQNVGPRYAATDEAPTVDDLKLAQQIIDEEIPDPTGGCTQFDAPKAQRKLLAAATPGYEKTPEELAEERSKNATLVKVPGVTSTRFWRPKNA